MIWFLNFANAKQKDCIYQKVTSSSTDAIFIYQCNKDKPHQDH